MFQFMVSNIYDLLDTIVHAYLQALISDESRLNASNWKWRCHNGSSYLRWSCDFNFVVVMPFCSG